MDAMKIDWDARRIELDPQAFRQAISEFRRVCGDANVADSGAELERVAKATIPEPRRPSAVVRPGSAGEVAEVVRIANRFRIPLWPVSQGRNWGYGSSTPALANTVVLHLGRLNRILEVNEELAYAVIEPGVTYRQLRAHLDAHHPQLWCDSTDGPPEGSVIGNALDRGLGVTHYADHFGTLCGLEVVLPSGETVRTGGGPPECKTWNTHKWGVGPYLEGLFSQSNFGIVVKAGVWLFPKPEAFASFTFDLARPDDLPQLVDAMRELALRGILGSACHLINDIVTLAVLTQYPSGALERYSRLPDDVLAELRKRYGVPVWSLGGGILGTRAQVREVKRQLRRRLSSLGRIMFMDDRLAAFAGWLGGLATRSELGRRLASAAAGLAGKSVELLQAAPHVHSVLKGIPSDYFVRHAYFKSRPPKPELADPDRDDIGLIWFAPIAPMTGRHVQELIGLCRPLFEKHGFDFYAALLMQNARSMIVLMSIFYMKGDLDQVRRAKQLYQELGRATAGAGFQQYRMAISSRLSADNASAAFVGLGTAIKRGIDPTGTLAPGKYGIG
jgi:4-cresol dehydrogenase (hydroxylating)